MLSVEEFIAWHPPQDGDEEHDAENTSGGGQGGELATESDDSLDARRESALRLLDAAPRSSGALRDRLLAKGYQEDVVEDVVLRLQRVGLIDDRAYAQQAVRYCVNRNMGRRGAVMEMLRKGVDRSLAEETARIADEQGLFVDAAWALGRSVDAKTKALDHEVRKRRFWSAGGRKGHEPEILREVATELFDAPSHA